MRFSPRILSLTLALGVFSLGTGCSKKPADNTQAANQQQTQDAQQQQSAADQNAAPGSGSSSQYGSTPAKPKAGNQPNVGIAKAQPAPELVIPEGTVLSVRLGQSISTKSSNAGDQFTATLAEPLLIGDKTAAQSGTPATGTVVEAVPLGRFKGGAKLRLSLDALDINGKRYPVQTTAVAREMKGKGKRTGGFIGGGAAFGALVGGLAGGGKGAAIGAAAGAGAGTAGAAYTGNKNIVLPAETILSFKLTQPLSVKQ